MIAAGTGSSRIINASGHGGHHDAPLASGGSPRDAHSNPVPKPALPSWILNPGTSATPEADLPPEMANVPTDTPADQ
jgi:hypothetical protein